MTQRLILLRTERLFSATRPHPANRIVAWCGMLIASWIGAFGGCAKVDSRGDFAQAAQGIKDRLDVENAYDPAAEEAAESAITVMIADGLTVDEAVNVALLNNRTLQALFQSIGASRADLVQSQLLSNPSLMIGARFPEGGGRSELTLGMAQQVVDLWQIPVRRQIAEAQLQQTILEVMHEGVRIATTTRTLCFEYLWRQNLHAIAKDNLQLAERSTQLAQVRLNAGDASPLDVGLVQTTVLEAQVSALQALRDMENARLSLAQIMGIARRETPWELRDSFAPHAHDFPPEELLIETALANRFDLQLADARVEMAARDVELESMKVFPSIFVGFQGERTEGRGLPGRDVLADTARSSVAAGRLTAPSIQSKGQRAQANSQIIDALLGPTVQLTLPIWDQNQAQIAKAQSILQQEAKQREQLMDLVVTETRQAANNARSAFEQYTVIERQMLPQVEANLRAAQSRYENGEDSVLILIDAQEAAFLQKRAALDVMKEYLQAMARLAEAVGGKLPHSDSSVSQADTITNLSVEQD